MRLSFSPPPRLLGVPMAHVPMGAVANELPAAAPVRNNPPTVEVYGLPSPPKSFFFAGAGWAYGVGCGLGPFFGMGVALGPRPLFGAGLGMGAFCGIGFGAGAVTGNGTGYIPVGANLSFFYAPRLMWAERIVDRYGRDRPSLEPGPVRAFNHLRDLVKRTFSKLF